MTTYAPIACVDHERLEYAVLKQAWLDLAVTSGVHAGPQRLLPLDVYTRDGAEWLVARTEAGEQWTLRLDMLAFESGATTDRRDART